MPSAKKLALLAVAGAALTAASAPSAQALTIKGRGFGHGIGMSQYGAYGQAKAGIGYQQILKHYYTGTTLQTVSPSPNVRVLLQRTRTVRFTGAASVAGTALSPTESYSAVVSGAEIVIRDASGAVVARGAAPLEIAPPAGQPFTLKGQAIQGLSNGLYRGTLQLRFAGKTVSAINSIDLENYVRGVISAESPASWPADALRAQAVTARTYAITTSAGAAQGFDQWPDTRSQMYRGVAAEKPTTDAATAATAGQVVALNGKPVTTFFFSTSGGYTENNEFSFLAAKPLNWLRAVNDPYDVASPRHKWTIKLTRKQLNKKLRRYLKGGRFKRIKVTQRGVSPRVVTANVIGTRGTTPVTGAQLRAALGLYDTWAAFGGKDIAPPGGDSDKSVAPPAAAPSSPSGGLTP
ncbi:MAG TPA: SpoIID/LytB domain-containing protein [Baekduia sp.]|nr:SpoIID/LytB domain-containing protein [Baekduia sp.]